MEKYTQFHDSIQKTEQDFNNLSNGQKKQYVINGQFKQNVNHAIDDFLDNFVSDKDITGSQKQHSVILAIILNSKNPAFVDVMNKYYSTLDTIKVLEIEYSGDANNVQTTGMQNDVNDAEHTL